MQHLTSNIMVLQVINESDPERYTKSSLMLGLGETEQEVIETMKELGSTNVSMLIRGHYWQPCSRHLPVKRYMTSDKFNWFPKQQNKSDFPVSLQIRWLEARTRQKNFFLTELIMMLGVAAINDYMVVL